jgi:hypothetical protein
MKTRFLACTACSRHVRAGDSRCPFCGASAPPARPLRTVTERLSRAAIHAAGAAGAVVAISDCGLTDARGSAFYGAACIDTDGSCGVTITDSGADSGIYVNDANPIAFYGGAPCLDGSCFPPEDASVDAPDASTDGGEDSADAVTSDAGDDGPG